MIYQTRHRTPILQTTHEVDNELNDFISYYHNEGIVSEVKHIIKLFERNCQEKGCTGYCSVVNTRTEGGVLVINWKCSEGHCGLWESSSILTGERGQKVYPSTILQTALVIVTGNNFCKHQMLMKFLNVAFISESTFSLIQSTCVAAVIKELWEKMKEMWETMEGMQRCKDLVLAGDG